MDPLRSKPIAVPGVSITHLEQTEEVKDNVPEIEKHEDHRTNFLMELAGLMVHYSSIGQNTFWIKLKGLSFDEIREDILEDDDILEAAVSSSGEILYLTIKSGLKQKDSMSTLLKSVASQPIAE